MALGALTRHQSKGKAQFLADEDGIAAAKYQFIVAIEAAISICNHLTSRLGTKVPESYADCFLGLRENKFISEELGNSLANMAKFRNLLVHLYWQVDNARVYELIPRALEDLPAYLKQVGQIIQVDL